MIAKGAIIVIARATALPGNEAVQGAAIDEVIPPALAEEAVSIFRLREDLEQLGHFLLYEHTEKLDKLREVDFGPKSTVTGGALVRLPE